MPQPQVSRPQLGGAMALYTAGGLFWSFLPFFIGLQEEAASLSSARAGTLGSLYLLGFTLVSLLGPWWVERWQWRGWTSLAVLGIWAALGTLSATTRYPILLMACLAVGVGMGAFWVLAFRVFGAATHPQRAFGLAVTLGYAVLALVTYGIGHLVLPSTGLLGITLAIAVLVGILAIPTGWLSSLRFVALKPATALSEHSPASPIPGGAVCVALLGVVLLSLSFAAIWAFAERIGSAAGFSHAQIASVLSCNLLVTGSGSLLASLLGSRCPRWLLLAACGALLVACDLLMIDVTRYLVYILAVSGMGLAVGIGMPVQLGVVAKFDQAGRYVPLVAAAQGLGTALGPALGGVIYGQGHVRMLVGLATTSALASVGLLLVLLGWARYSQARP